MTMEWCEGRHYYRRAGVEQSAVLVDARSYYRAFYRAALQAERYLVVAGWQFDSEVALLRGPDAENAPLPVRFLPFLSALCGRRPELRIYLLAWDFSLVYALEREWMQRLRFAVGAPEGLRFEFDTHPLPRGSHHQKFAVVDGQLAFVGGMDICDARWDDRRHAPHEPLRVDVAGDPCRPNHEVQAAVVGDAALDLAELFRARWQNACGERITLPEPPSAPAARFDLAELSAGDLLPIRAREVWISRTSIEPKGTLSCEIRSAFTDVLRSAERFIYAETQYFTSRTIAAALLERLRDRSLPKLSIAMVLPRGADSTKEHFALGEAQSAVLGALEEAARAEGHDLAFFCSVAGDDNATFIHSKVLIVDDSFLAIGSANFTERSMGADSELALIWRSNGDAALAADIVRARASLLAEHAARAPEELTHFENILSDIRTWIAEGSTRLRICHYEPVAPNPLKTLIFDPGGPITLPLPETETEPPS
jgi:phosphatidylserine/phosphatidylglycerophosphate/cardiolipin synthase-like enzyme